MKLIMCNDRNLGCRFGEPHKALPDPRDKPVEVRSLWHSGHWEVSPRKTPAHWEVILENEKKTLLCKELQTTFVLH